MSVALYPGSFDPMTNGHVDIVLRGLKVFDKVIVAIAHNGSKNHTFSIEERLALARASLAGVANVEFYALNGLLIDFAQKIGVGVVLRGLRAVSDFEYEFQLAGMNHKLAPDIETVFMMTSEENLYLSSRLIREIARFGGDVRPFVPAPVADALRERFGPPTSNLSPSLVQAAEQSLAATAHAAHTNTNPSASLSQGSPPGSPQVSSSPTDAEKKS